MYLSLVRQQSPSSFANDGGRRRHRAKSQQPNGHHDRASFRRIVVNQFGGEISYDWDTEGLLFNCLCLQHKFC